MEKTIKKNSYWCYICELKVELSEFEKLKCPNCNKEAMELLKENKNKIDFTAPNRTAIGNLNSTKSNSK